MSAPNPTKGSGGRLLLIVFCMLTLGAYIGANYLAPACQ